MNKTLVALLALPFTGAVGCSSQQLYGAGQGWHQTECYKIPDRQEQDRCLSNASMSYEQYKLESKAALEPK